MCHILKLAKNQCNMEEKEPRKRKQRTYAERQVSLKRNLPRRQAKFEAEVWQYRGLYPDKQLQEFIDFYTEPNHSKTKMRFELYETWSTEYRLKKWDKTTKSFRPNYDPQRDYTFEEFERELREGRL